MPPKITLNITHQENQQVTKLRGTNVLLTAHRVAMEAFRRGLRQYVADPGVLAADLGKGASHD